MKVELIHQARTTRQSIQFVLFAIFVGFLYPVLAGELHDPISILNGVLIGFLGGVFIAFIERPSMEPRHSGVHFIRKVAIKSTYYTLFFGIVVLLVIALTRGMETGVGFFAYLQSDYMRHFIFREDYHIILAYILLFSAALVFTKQLKRKIGPSIFLHTITGKYYRPKTEDRIFMFLDLKSSTTIAERLGELRFHRFLNQFFYDITPSIEVTEGEIYRYVGDEVVISWPQVKGLKHANCIRTHFHALGAIRKKRENYLRDYGFVPKFRTALHMGSVMCGELGDVKTQIVFLGDTLYMGSSLLKFCKTEGLDLVVTDPLVGALTLPGIYELDESDSTKYHLPTTSMRVYSVKEKEMDSF